MSQPQTINEALANAKTAFDKYRSTGWKRESAVTEITFIEHADLLTKEHVVKLKRADDALEAAYAESQEADRHVKRLLNNSATMWRLFPDEMNRVNAELAQLAAPDRQRAA